MIHPFRDLVTGGVLIAPLVGYAALSFVVLLLLRPILRLIGFEHAFANPPLALLCVYLTILAGSMLLF